MDGESYNKKGWGLFFYIYSEPKIQIYDKLSDSYLGIIIVIQNL